MRTAVVKCALSLVFVFVYNLMSFIRKTFFTSMPGTAVVLENCPGNLVIAVNRFPPEQSFSRRRARIKRDGYAFPTTCLCTQALS